MAFGPRLPLLVCLPVGSHHGYLCSTARHPYWQALYPRPRLAAVHDWPILDLFFLLTRSDLRPAILVSRPHTSAAPSASASCHPTLLLFVRLLGTVSALAVTASETRPARDSQGPGARARPPPILINHSLFGICLSSMGSTWSSRFIVLSFAELSWASSPLPGLLARSRRAYVLFGT